MIGVSQQNIAILTVRDAPAQYGQTFTDVFFTATGSNGLFRPAKLNGLVWTNRVTVSVCNIDRLISLLMFVFVVQQLNDEKNVTTLVKICVKFNLNSFFILMNMVNDGVNARIVDW